MERLTEVENGTAMIKGCGSNCKYGFEYCRKEDWENCEIISNVIDKLAEYEDLEEQGLLLKLPCKVGDKLYVVGSKCFADVVEESVCVALDCNNCVYDEELIVFERLASKYLIYTMFIDDNPNFSFGNTVFLSKEEAEQKLKEIVEEVNEINRCR